MFWGALLYADTTGGYAQDFFDYGIGARYLGMGSAGRTIATDATAGYWNSALLPKVSGINISCMSTTLMGLTQYNQYGVSCPLSYTDVIGLNYFSTNVDGLEVHGKTLPTTSTPASYFSAGNTAVMLSYGKQLFENLNIGITGKYAQRTVYGSQDSVTALDIGFLSELFGIQFGGNVRNAYAQVVGDTSDTYPLDFDFGFNTHIFNWLICADASRITRKDIAYAAGIEWPLIQIKNNVDLRIRGGWNSNQLSCGVGLMLAPMVLDYAFIVNDTSQSHIFSLGMSLLDNTNLKNMEKAEAYYRKALQAIESRDYDLAQKNIEAGLQEYPDLFVLKELGVHLSKAIAIEGKMPSQTHDTVTTHILSDIIYSFLKADFDTVLDDSEFLYQHYQTMDYYDIQNYFEKEIGRSSKYKNKKMISELLSEALSSILYNNNVDNSNKLLLRALYFEPDNVSALKRLGSNYYIAGKTTEANALWQKALKLSPDDEELRNLLHKGKITKADLTQIQGIPAAGVDAVWNCLVKAQLINERGFVNLAVNPLTQPLGLPEELQKYEQALRHYIYASIQEVNS